jgi:hypothetical protein
MYFQRVELVERTREGDARVWEKRRSYYELKATWAFRCNSEEIDLQEDFFKQLKSFPEIKKLELTFLSTKNTCNSSKS